MNKSRDVVRCGLLGVILLAAPFSVAALDVVDDLGNALQLTQPAQRIVSLAPHITELLFAAGAGEQIVGVVSYSDYPDAARSIAMVGSYRSVSEESLIALQPDLIIAWHSGNGPDIIARLRALGFKVYANEPRVLSDIANSLRSFGIMAGLAESGAQAANTFLEAYEELRARYEKKRPVSVFYEVWNKPLTTVNGEHLISDVIALCGGRNVFADALPLAPKIGIESVIRLDPEAIVASGMSLSRPRWLDDWRDWPSLQAVQREQLYFVPPDLLQRHTPRILDGARQLCRHLDQVRTRTDDIQ